MQHPNKGIKKGHHPLFSKLSTHHSPNFSELDYFLQYFFERNLLRLLQCALYRWRGDQRGLAVGSRRVLL